MKKTGTFQKLLSLVCTLAMIMAWLPILPAAAATPVLVEDFDPVSEAHFGRSAADAPEIDGKVYFRAAVRPMPGSYVDVQISDVVDYDLFGEAVYNQ